MKKIIVFFCMLLMGPLFCYSEYENTPEILLINSYHPGFEWSDNIEKELTAVLLEHYPHMSINIEYYDSKRYSITEIDEIFFNYLSEKYSNVEFDIILTSDDNAFQFVIKHREELFGDTPYVFCGLNNIDIYDFTGKVNLTGIAEDFDISANLQLIKSVLPDVENVAVIFDSTSSGNANRFKFQTEKIKFEDDFSFIELTDLTKKELLDALANLPEKSAVLNLGFWRDSNNIAFEPSESLSMIVNSTSAPVFGAWAYLIKAGHVGGIATSGLVQGRMLAERTVSILNGTPANTIPVFREKTTTPIFDYYALKKYKIQFSKLPDGSVIKNLPNNLFYNDPFLFWFSFLTTIVLLILLILLAINFFKRTNSENLFKSLFNNLPDIVLVHTASGEVVLNNLIAEPLINNLTTRLSEQADLYLDSQLNWECQIEDRYFNVHSVKIKYRYKKVLLSIFRDITSRVEFENDLQNSLHENTVLLKEVHHRVKNNLQIICSLLSLQADYIKDQAAYDALVESQDRIMTMSQVHEMLYRNNNLSEVDLHEYIESLVSSIRIKSGDEIRFRITAEQFFVSIDNAISLGLILNELLSNSIKHAFGEKNNNNQIEIICRNSNTGFFEVVISDNGRGFNYSDREDESLGLKLVDILVAQIKAELQFNNDNGSKYTIKIPLKDEI